MKLQKNNLKWKRTSSEICCIKLHRNLWPVVCPLRKMQRYHSSFLDLLAADLRLNGRLALAQSCSHRWCQGNRGNFCLINDIGFDIFPSSPFRRLRSCPYLWHWNSFCMSTCFTVIVAENYAGESSRSRCKDRTIVTTVRCVDVVLLSSSSGMSNVSPL